MNQEFLNFIIVFWSCWFFTGLAFLLVSISTLIDCVGVNNLSKNGFDRERNGNIFYSILNLSFMLVFWPLISLLIIIIAYLFSSGKIKK